MRSHIRPLSLLLTLAILLALLPAGASAATILEVGSRGDDVK